MSKEEKYYCARCNADMTSKKFNCYASDVDRKLICFECFQKEQPKYLIEKIINLETKLAESEREIKEWIAVRDDKNNVINKQTEKINQLKQQLAEKEKEIEKWKTKWCGSETNSLRLYEQSQNNNQDKISFCIEKLDKFKVLRGLILNMRMTGFEEYRNKIPMKYLAIVDAHMEKLADIVDDQVDNQINELKGNTNVE